MENRTMIENMLSAFLFLMVPVNLVFAYMNLDISIALSMLSLVAALACVVSLTYNFYVEVYLYNRLKRREKFEDEFYEESE